MASIHGAASFTTFAKTVCDGVLWNVVVRRVAPLKVPMESRRRTPCVSRRGLRVALPASSRPPARRWLDGVWATLTVVFCCPCLHVPLLGGIQEANLTGINAGSDGDEALPTRVMRWRFPVVPGAMDFKNVVVTRICDRGDGNLLRDRHWSMPWCATALSKSGFLFHQDPVQLDGDWPSSSVWWRKVDAELGVGFKTQVADLLIWWAACTTLNGDMLGSAKAFSATTIGATSWFARLSAQCHCWQFACTLVAPREGPGIFCGGGVAAQDV